MKIVELFTLLQAGMQEAFGDFNSRYADEMLCGYALCTDDDVSTLSCAAVTLESLRKSDDHDLLFCPTDWPYQLQSHSLDLVDAELRNRALEARDIRSHIDSHFQLLVEALSALRTGSVVADSVFLSVLSTDPGQYAEELELRSIERLNTDHVIRAHGAFLEKWK